MAHEALLEGTATHAAFWGLVEPVEDATLEAARATRHDLLTLLLAGLRFSHVMYGLSNERLAAEALCRVLNFLHHGVWRFSHFYCSFLLSVRPNLRLRNPLRGGLRPCGHGASASM